MTYRADIDGLRAIAVLSVIIFHLFPQVLPGGFIGVDIFFVISGFLISKIIFTELSHQNFSFKNFYARRIRRIFPALICTLAICLVYGYFVLFGYEFKQLSKHVLRAATFLSNRTLYYEAAVYFDVSANQKPLLHLWSLAVEEQFYLLWPLGAWLIWKFFPQKQIISLLTVLSGIIISYSCYVLLYRKNPHLAFYSVVTRFWELGIGVLVAYIKTFYQKRTFHHALPFHLISLGLIGGCLFLLYPHKPHFSQWMTLPVVATAILIYVSQNTFVSRLLSSKALVSIGLISYPLYLLHWPAISFLHIIQPSALTLGVKISLLLILFISAWLIYAFVETPLRHNPKSPPYLLGSMALLGLIGYQGYHERLKPLVIKIFPQAQEIDRALADWEYPPKDVREIEKDFFQAGHHKDLVFFFGDSNMRQYAPRLALIANKENSKRSAVFAALGGLCPLPKVHRTTEEKAFSERIRRYALSPQVRKVVICGQWSGYLSGGLSEYIYEGEAEKYSLGEETGIRKALQELELMIKELKKLGKEVYLIINMPVGQEYTLQHYFKRTLLGGWEFSPMVPIPKKTWDQKIQSIKKGLYEVAQHTGAFILNPEDDLCTQKVCKCYEGEIPIYQDALHLRAWYVKNYMTFLDFLFD